MLTFKILTHFRKYKMFIFLKKIDFLKNFKFIKKYQMLIFIF